jgi:type I restriction enzyme S subunit
MGVKWDQNTNKAVMGKTLNKSTISQIIVDVDDYEIQKQKAEALDSASKQLDIRNKEIQKLDTLVKARFVEMFGDPVKNTKEFGLTKLSDLGLLERGKSKHRPRNDPALLGGPYPLIQTGEVTNSGVYIKDYSSTYSDLGLAQSHMWPKGTLCITIAANIAQTAILNFDACFPDSVVGFISNDNSISTIYLHYWFTFFQKILDAQAPQVAQKNINLKILSNLKVIVPPLLLQQEFSSFVQQVDKSKVA